MKTLTLSLLTLLLTAPIHAQVAPAMDPAAMPAPLYVTETAVKPKTAKVLVLHSAPLQDVVAQMEGQIGEFRNASGEAATMPNFIFGPGTQDLVMPAGLSLRDVTPVQALTLVAVATGCALEPITAPPEAGDSPEAGDKIIGYQFTLLRSRYTGLGGAAWNLTPSKPIASDPVAAMSVGNAPEPTTQPASAANTRTPGIANPFTPETYTSGEIHSSTYGPFGGPAPAAPSMRNITLIAPAPVPVDTPTVRIYALGSVMRGSSELMKEQQVNLQTLMSEALDHAKLGGDAPVLSFHNASKALVVKGTAAQHDIVTQIITAMRENGSADPMPIIPR